MVVAADTDESNGGSYPGSAYVFYTEDDGFTWTELIKVLPSNGVSSDSFATSVAFSNDDTSFMVGASTDFGNSGAVYVYTIVAAPTTDLGFTYSENSFLVPAGPVQGFACSISIGQNNGHYYMAVGAKFDGDTGSAYIYLSFDAIDWSLSSVLIPNEPIFDLEFGTASAVLGEDVILIGAPGYSGLPDRSGAVYVFGPDESGTWSNQGRVLAKDGVTNDEFGSCVAMSDARFAVAGSPFDSSIGSANFFFVSVLGPINEKLSASDGNGRMNFGQSLDIWYDDLVVGAEEKNIDGPGMTD